MKTVHKSVLIWYSAAEMFALVTDVASYPEFLPWCDRAQILSDGPDGVLAEIGIAISGIRQSFVTRNRNLPTSRVELALVKGPFSQLTGAWTFAPLAEAAQIEADPLAARACRVELSLSYNFDNATLSKLVGPVFDKIAGSLVDAFVKRAEQVYA